MQKKKKWKKIVAVVAVLAILGGGAGTGVRYALKNKGNAVELYRVSDINAANWIGMGDMEGRSGMIVSGVSQNVQVPDDRVVEEVYVQEGDKVKIGDKLLSYDTTLLELDQELQELTVQEIELELKAAEADLAKLRNTRPVAKSNRDMESPELDMESFMDEARLMPGERDVLLAQETTSDTELLQPETVLQTDPPLADSTEATKEQTTEQGTEKEPDTGMQKQEETEQQIDGSDNTVIDLMSPDELGQVPEGGNGFASPEEILGKGDPSLLPPKLNQSLSGFLTNIRIKEKNAQGEETLLLDTIDWGKEEIPEAAVQADTIKLIPHFAESADHVFQKRDTYVLYIKGIHLEKELAGSIYGTDVIDGSDYPEIGGFTCVQEKDSFDVVRLTLAFHDGLEKEKEGGMPLLDMYLELELKAEEAAGEELIFRVSDQEEEDRKIHLPGMGQAEPGTDTGEGTETGMESGTDVLPEIEIEPETGIDVEPETEVTTESGTGMEPDTEAGTDTEPGTEIETSTESESETEPETGETEHISQFLVTVKWNHGTNDRAKWPETLTMKFYENEESAEPSFVKTVTGAYLEEGGSGMEEGESEPETESEWMGEIPQTGDGMEMEGATEEGIPDTESSVIEDDSDPYPVSTQIWKDISVDWTVDDNGSQPPLNPDRYDMSVYVKNYVPIIRWDAAEHRYTITMNYLEPEESPLTRLDPLAELDYASGAEAKYYKGTGTKEEPYVFFCTDGAVIRNTFVNWVLGFDELGTTRVSDGYCVILEIRESDSITGAFIKSIGLDGTIRTEYGYGPGTYWIFTSDAGIVKYEEEIPDEFPGGFEDPGWSDIGESYTAEELALAIAEKEREIRQLKVDEKKARLELKKYNQEMDDSLVVSAVNGYVKSTDGTDESGAYMVITSENGMYLKTSISELDLGTVEKGQKITYTSWETGMKSNATITSIDHFPESTSNNDYYSGNANSSSYPVIAVLEDEEGASEYESVSVQFPSEGQVTKNSVYLEKAFIRSENGQSYVYIADEKGLLKKQYIRTGGVNYGYMEIREGLSTEDRIAFPYGKDVKPGAKTKDINEDEY